MPARVDPDGLLLAPAGPRQFTSSWPILTGDGDGFFMLIETDEKCGILPYGWLPFGNNSQGLSTDPVGLVGEEELDENQSGSMD